MDFFVLFSNPGSLVLPRNGNIDVLRLIAASGIVWFHVGAPGQTVSYSALSLFIILMIVLPLQNPWSGSLRSYVAQRADRLIRPWIIWSGIFACFKIAQANTQNRSIQTEFDWSMLLVGTQTHLWFLPFGFVCSIAAFVATREIDQTSKFVFPFSLLVAIGSLPISAWALSNELPTPLAEWCYGLPAVFFGIAIYFANLSQRKLLFVSGGLLAGCLAAYLVSGGSWGLASFLIGVHASILALRLKVLSRPWMQLAAALSMPVYLCHPLFISLLQAIPGFDGGVETALACIFLSLVLGYAMIRSPVAKKLL